MCYIGSKTPAHDTVPATLVVPIKFLADEVGNGGMNVSRCCNRNI